MERLAFSCGLPAGALENTSRPDAPGPRAEHAPVAAHEARLERQDVLAYRSLLAFIFVLLIRPQDTLPFLEPLHLADMTAIFSVFALVAGRLQRGAGISRITTEFLAVLALGAVMLATAPFSVWPGGAVGIFTDLFSKVIIVFALMLNTVTTRARFERVVTLVVLGTSYIALRAVLDYGRGINLIEGGRVTGHGGLFGNPNDMALNMISFLPLGIAIALGAGRPALRLAALAGIPTIVTAIILTRSRGGTVGLLAMLVVLIYQIGRLRPTIAALVVTASLVTLPMLPASFTERMASIFDGKQDQTGSREARKTLLREGYQAFLDNPVVGLGAGQFQSYKTEEREAPWRETHNAVLQVASELGVVGLAVFIVIVGSGYTAAIRTGAALRRVRRRAPNRSRIPDGARAGHDLLELYSAAMIASLTGWLVAAMFASVAYYWTLYLVLALAVTLRDITMREIAAGAGAAREYRRAA